MCVTSVLQAGQLCYSSRFLLVSKSRRRWELLGWRVITVSGVDLQASFIGNHLDRTKTAVRLQIGRRIAEGVLTAEDLFDGAESAFQVGILTCRQNEASSFTAQLFQNVAAFRVGLVYGICVQRKNGCFGSGCCFFRRSERHLTGSIDAVGDENDHRAHNAISPV